MSLLIISIHLLSCLTACHASDGEDHRGPGFIPSGTLLERVLYVGDVLNKDKEGGETMAEMLGRWVIEKCGEEEFKRQIARAKEIITEDSAKKPRATKNNVASGPSIPRRRARP